jgi:hypothetical protein
MLINSFELPPEFFLLLPVEFVKPVVIVTVYTVVSIVIPVVAVGVLRRYG